MRLNTNLMSLNVYKGYTKALKTQETAFNRISTGLKINSAKDDPNNLGQSEMLRLQIRGLQAAERNLQDGASMLQTFDGALSSVSESLTRMKELVVQGSTGSLNSEDQANIQKEIDQLKEHINSVTKNTEFNGVKLLDDQNVTDNNKPGFITTSVGANVGELAKIPTFNTSTAMLGKDGVGYLEEVNLLDPTSKDKNLEIIDSAVNSVNSIRSKYGAVQNKFESLSQGLGEISQSVENAESSLRDADIAEEMMNYSRESILVNSSIAMMVQTNKLPQDVLQILERIK
nr:flagellin [Clostridium sp. UBA1652]